MKSKRHEQSAVDRWRGTVSRREFVNIAGVSGLAAGLLSVRKLVAAADVKAASPLHPDAARRVIHVRHTEARSEKALIPPKIREMLDSGITELTGIEEPAQAWRSLFRPKERIAIKINTIGSGGRGSEVWTHPELVSTVTDILQEIGIPAEQIVVFDRSDGELRRAGYVINDDGPGVRCQATGDHYQPGWQLVGEDVRLSRILLNCDALINMPILKSHGMAGLSFAMKNHYGTFERPEDFHAPERMKRCLTELNALAPIIDRCISNRHAVILAVLYCHEATWQCRGVREASVASN
jgi:hypothetical protein